MRRLRPVPAPEPAPGNETRAELRAQVDNLRRQLAIARAARPEGRLVALVELVRIVHAATSTSRIVSEAWQAGHDHVLKILRARIGELRRPGDDPALHINDQLAADLAEQTGG